MLDYLTYELINNHLKNYFDDKDIFVFDEISSPDFHLDTYLIRPGIGREFYTLITGGVSGIPMKVPDPQIPAHIELMLLLPKDWSFEDDQWRNRDAYWPIELIKSLGRFPHSNGTFIGFGHTIPESKDSYLYSKGFVATLLLKSSLIDDAFQKIYYENGFIDVLMPIPLYQNEYEYKKERGLSSFIEQMLMNDYPNIVNINRKSII